MTTERIVYGPHPLHFGELTLTVGAAPRGTVVLVHGGFWRAGAGWDGVDELGGALVEAGWHVWRIQYRGVGEPDGGGWPRTTDDVAAAIDHLAVVATDRALDLGPVVTVGHSAGGHLAVWALDRRGATNTDAPRLDLVGAVSLAGVLDLRLSEAQNLGQGAAQAFVGGASAEHPGIYDAASPSEAPDAGRPVRLVHGDDDDVVPLSQSESYLAAARRAGQDAWLTTVEGDHMAVVGPSAEARAAVIAAVASLSS